MKELEGKSKDDFIKKAMKMQGYSEEEADTMISQGVTFKQIPETNVIESMRLNSYGKRRN
jgi:hypothetical protein